MTLSINFFSIHPLSPDDIRSFWQFLINPHLEEAFRLANFQENLFLLADKAINHIPVPAYLFFKKETSFLLITQVQSLNSNSSIVTLKFEDSQAQTTLMNTYKRAFFAWVLQSLKIGGRILNAEISFLSYEKAPNQEIGLRLESKYTFSIDQYPLMMWFNRIQVSEDFIQGADFIKKDLKKYGYFLLPSGIYDKILQPILEPVTALTEKEKELLARADLFISIPEVEERREILRWIIHDKETSNSSVDKILKYGLKDPDWEVRMTAMIACVRLKARKLIHAVRAAELPKTSKTGLSREEQNIMVGIKNVTIDLLNGYAIPKSIQKIPQTPEEKKVYLTRCVAGKKMKYYHDAFTLVIALTDPLYPPKKPSKLPGAIEEVKGKYFLKKSRIPMSWIPNIHHWVGNSYTSYHPIRLINIENGAFVSTLPVQKNQIANLVRINEPEPVPIKCTYPDAKGICTRLSELENTRILIPNHTTWEMAARGHNGRHYPWGLSYEKDMLNRLSPWGLKNMVGYGGEWTNAQTKSGHQIIMGASESLRCAEMKFANPNTVVYPFRIIIQGLGKVEK